MTNASNYDHSDLRSKLESNLEAKVTFTEILDFLPACESVLISYMADKGVWSGPVPILPIMPANEPGAIELGLFLYWFHNVELLDLSMFTPHQQKDIKKFIDFTNGFLDDTNFNATNYEVLKNGELIFVDGTVLNMEIYATFDQGWFIAFLNLLKTTIHWAWYNLGLFPFVTPPVLPLVGKDPNTVNIAIIGDWGAGNDNAMTVMDAVQQLKPDYILHVGDTYYGGTPLASDVPFGDIYYAPGEEVDHLVKPWPAGFEGKSFSLNSNHEMYSGANGLFYNAYGTNQTPVGANTPFSAHQGSSCFALTLGDWTILGLDSAFHGKVKKAFMTGSLGAIDGTQAKWIKGLQLDPKKTIVFTHHNGFEDNTKTVSPLWAELQHMLGGDPFAWYWGHIHNGIVYNKPVSIKTPLNPPDFTTHTYARCLGHASLPYGVASSLDPSKITYNANNLKPNSNELYNGFAMLSLTTNANGDMEKISEAFYDVGPDPTEPRYVGELL